MFDVVKSKQFTQWASKLKDRRALTRINARIDRAMFGNLGDVKFLRDSVSEMRIDVGSGYRLYFTRRGTTVIVLLCGGDKSTQNKDIEHAVELANVWKE